MTQTSPARRQSAAIHPVPHPAPPAFAAAPSSDTLPGVSHPSQRATNAALVDLASSRYRAAGRFAYHFAHCKLRMDPLFAQALALGLIPDSSHVLDLGCGQGLLATWLLAARDYYACRSWPGDWRAPPRLASYVGIELMERDVERARLALTCAAACAEQSGDRPNPLEIRHADICHTTFRPADVVVILDVLHYMTYDAQETVLTQVRAAISSAGMLLLRVGNAHGGLRFAMSRWVDQTTTLFRGHRVQLHCRSLPQWSALLSRIGFTTGVLPMSAGTPFANYLLIARPQ